MAPAIVLVIGGLQSGGAERQLAELANSLARRGWKTTVATWTGRGKPDFYPLESDISRVWLNEAARERSEIGRAHV